MNLQSSLWLSALVVLCNTDVSAFINESKLAIPVAPQQRVAQQNPKLTEEQKQQERSKKAKDTWLTIALEPKKTYNEEGSTFSTIRMTTMKTL